MPQRVVTPMLVVALAILSMVGPISTDMYLSGFPVMQDDLHTSAGTIQLTLSFFMAGMAIGQLVWGPLSDSLGRRLPLVVAVTAFVVASVLAALSTNVWVLIVMRLFQGFTGSAGVVISRAVARDLASGVRLAKLYGMIGIVMGIAPIAAPVAGGLLMGSIGWRGILTCVAGVAVIMALFAYAVVPESLEPSQRVAGGLRAMGRSLVTVVSDVPFLGYTAAAIFAFGTVFAYISSSSVVLQEVYGLTTVQFTLCFALNAAGMMAMGLLNVRLVERVRSQKLLAIALIVLVAGSVVLFVLCHMVARIPLWVLIGLVFVTTTVNPLIMANTSTLGLGRHGHNAGMASALMGALQFAVAGIVSPMVTVTGEVSIQSMASVMAVTSLLAGGGMLLTRRAMRRKA